MIRRAMKDSSFESPRKGGEGAKNISPVSSLNRDPHVKISFTGCNSILESSLPSFHPSGIHDFAVCRWNKFYSWSFHHKQGAS
ncbi:hypothetical protein JTE90_012192 [Oedothorax gibbosus]|uniref:Uncharacterized protein n=1 Tax=Oedothorax gibbosus TaxID=931172 RepID=A0AAV6V9I8_9ARAC|nr:hypothetical protein JTE90_012192 [Oedothorax gibbosus]